MKAYLDTNKTIGERVELLLKEMTLEEKIGQLMQLNGQDGYPEQIEKYHVGSLLHINGADADRAIDLSLKTRLGIPVLLADDGIHGHSFWAGATIFPTQLALACSWDTALMEEVARVTAREMRATGLKWTFSPVLCLARDLRWGRIGETFGEDPFLIGEFACAMIRGYQGRKLGHPDAVLATAKHYAGYSETLGGRDASEAELTKRKLLSSFLPPFRQAARQGVMAFMTGYQSMDGVPSTANRWLLTEVLRDEWRFEGVLVTDWDNVGSLVRRQRVCADFAEAAALAVKCGNDLIMVTPEFRDGALAAVERGLLSEAEIDAVARRILLLKFRLGLFENPGFSDPERVRTQIGCAEHRAANLDLARESLVLLENDGLLPLDGRRLRSVAVVGPNADDPLAQLGDWSLGSGQMDGANGPRHPRESISTVLDGLRALAPAGCAVRHAAGCSVDSPDLSGVKAAAKLAKRSDLTVLVLGDGVAQTGELKSTATLELQGGQIALAEAVLASGKPVVVVLVNSKPLVLPACVKRASALIEAFNPGMAGGQAVAELIFGRIEPAGRLPLSIPVHVGQQPVFYNQVPGQHGDRYADLTQEPAYSFGYGLSYTSFEIGDLRLSAATLGRADTLAASVSVRNAGSRPGVATVQLYIEDLVTSATWAVRELKGFARVALAPGEERRVEISVPAAACSIVDAEGRRVVEAGDFRVHVGSSSRPADCLSENFRVVD